MTKEGRRINNFDGPGQLLSGEYGKWRDVWYAATPNGHVANLSRYEVTEHADGTITVAPSIRVAGVAHDLWHGFLERGVWRTA